MSSISIYHLPLYYVYKITNTETGEFYFGSRFAHVKRNRTPAQDFLVHYFTSSVRLKEDIKLNPTKYRGEILYCSNESITCDGCVSYVVYWYEQLLIRDHITDSLCMNGNYLDPDSNVKAFCVRGNPNYWFGKSRGPCSEETKQKISAKLKGRKLSGDVVEKHKQRSVGKQFPMAGSQRAWAVNTGKTRSEETKQKISKSTKGIKRMSAEAKQKIGDSLRSAYAEGRRNKNNISKSGSSKPNSEIRAHDQEKQEQ